MDEYEYLEWLQAHSTGTGWAVVEGGWDRIDGPDPEAPAAGFVITVRPAVTQQMRKATFD